MKKTILASFVFCLCLCSFGLLSAHADGKYESLTYKVTEAGTVTITFCRQDVDGEVVIPETLEGKPVTKIGSDAFYNCKFMTKVTIPDSVKTIGSSVFVDCIRLTEVVIPNSVTTIGSSAFNKFSGKLYIEDLAAWCGIEFGNASANPMYGDGTEVYLNGELLRQIVIPNGVTQISDYAFNGYDGFSSLTIPEGVTSIGADAFCECSSLKIVDLPEGLITIGDSAFNGCSALIGVTIPASVKTIGSFAFWECGALTSVTFSGTVETVGSDAFEDCDNLSGVYITDLSGWCGINFGNYRANPTYYANCLFVNNERLTQPIIPNDVTRIGNCAFINCHELTKVTLPEGLTSVGNSAFYGCYQLTDINLPKSLKELGSYAFYECKMPSVTIPAGMTTIGKSAFGVCAALKTLYIEDLAAWCGISFGDDDANPMSRATEVYVNGALLETLEIPSTVTAIEAYAFNSCTGMKVLILPRSVTRIEQSAFARCSNLARVLYAGSEADWYRIYIADGNTPLTNLDCNYNATQQTYQFVTNCAAAVEPITGYYAAAPTITNGHKKLVGWYDNASCSGSPVTFPYYGTATTLYALWADGASFEDAIALQPNMTRSVSLTEEQAVIYYCITPRISGAYRFYTTGSCDTYGALYDSEKSRLKYSNNRSNEDKNFYIEYNLTAGKTYYLAVELYKGSDGTFELVTETDCVASLALDYVTAATDELIVICTPHYIPTGSVIILTGYQNGEMIELQSDVYEGKAIYFIVKHAYDNAKVMAWDSLQTLVPLCAAETVSGS